MTFFRFLSSLVPVYLIGWTSLRFSLDPNSSFTKAERSALALGLGFGCLTLEMFFMALLRLPWNPFSLFLPWLFLLPFSFLKKGRGAGEKRVSPVPLSSTERSLCLFLFFLLLYVTVEALTLPLTYYEFWDAWSIWGHKARAFALRGTVDFSFFTDPSRYFSHQEYPLLLPLSESWIYLGLGRIDEATVKFLFPFFFLSFLVLFWGASRRERGRKESLILTVFLATLPLFLQYVVQGYAEIPLTFYYTFSTLYLYFWCKDLRREDLWIGVLFSTFAAWTKNEGLALFTINFFLFATARFAVSRQGFRKKALLEIALLLTPLFLLFPWYFLLARLGISSEFWPLPWNVFLIRFPRILPILTTFFWKLIDIHSWNLLWVGLIFFGSLCWRDIFSFPKILLTLAIFFHWALYVFIYIIHPGEVVWVMNVDDGYNRILLHAAPLALFLLGSLLKWEREDLQAR